MRDCKGRGAKGKGKLDKIQGGLESSLDEKRKIFLDLQGLYLIFLVLHFWSVVF